MARKRSEIALVFRPKTEAPEVRILGTEEKAKEFVVKLRDLVDWFRDFRVDSIELWVEGGLESGNLTKLLVSVEGKGGCKITLKPKE